MNYGDWTIQIRSSKGMHDIFRVWFDKDGTYSVSAPFHSANSAGICVALVAAKDHQRTLLTTLMKTTSLRDGVFRLRLAHHPDGKIEMSFPNPPNADELVESLTILRPHNDDAFMPSPTFFCDIRHLDEFRVVHELSNECVVFDDAKLAPGREPDLYGFQIAWFPADWREFLVADADGWNLRFVGADRGVIVFRALLASRECDQQGFVGIRFKRSGTTSLAQGGFQLEAVGENINPEDPSVKESLFCLYPGPGPTTNAG
jgi:hypothetical protein